MLRTAPHPSFHGGQRQSVRRWGLFAGAMALLPLLSACGSDESALPCVPNQTQECLGASSCNGVQACLSDGSGFSPCDCGSAQSTESLCQPGAIQDCLGASACSGSQTCLDTGAAFSACDCGSSQGAGGSGAMNAGGNGGTSDMSTQPVPPLRGLVGTPCATDSDCPVSAAGEALLTCVGVEDDGTFGSGGPQGGYCTLPCTDTGSECAEVDDNSLCGGAEVCMAICLPGNDPNALKCRSAAQACVPIQLQVQGLQVGVCEPVCHSDASCGEGRTCVSSGARALCTAEPAGSGAIGTACTPETQQEDCSTGLCVQLVDGAGINAGPAFCSSNCMYLSPRGCGNDGASLTSAEQPPESLCLGGGPNTGPLDLGFCFPLCDVDEDCGQPGLSCLRSENILLQFDRQGQCVPGQFVEPSPEADAGVPDAGSN